MPLRREPSPRYKIKALSNQLRKLSFPTSRISVKLATFAADAFDKFLSHQCSSLDEAFGLEKDRGAPRKLSKAKQHLALAREVFALRLANKSWYEIENALGQDIRALSRIYKPFKARLMSREILRKLNRSNPARRKKANRVASDAAKKKSHEQTLSEEERWAAWKKQHDEDWATYLRWNNNSQARSVKTHPDRATRK